jgi:fibronectin type 3 domain-containing protein
LGYEVLRRSGEDKATSIASLDPSTLEYNDTSVVQGMEYLYAVVAVNIRGPSLPSVEVSSTPMDIPAPPTDLKATSGDGYVLLGWGPPEHDGGSPVLAYEIWRNDTAGMVTMISLDHADHEYNDTGLMNGRMYTYRMTARNLAGRSLSSSELCVVPASLPDPPSDIKARSGNGYVHLEWRAPEDDGGFDIAEFRIIRSDDGSEPSEIGCVPGHDGSFNDTKVDNGIVYRYWISAETMIGPSPLAGPVEAIPIGLPETPRDLSATRGDGYVVITWLPPLKNGGSPVVQYSVLRGISVGSMRAIATIGNDSLLYNDTSVRNGVTYHYAVRAINPFFGSEISESMWTVPMGRPDPPTDVKAELVSGMVRLTWNPPADTKGSVVEGYRINKRIGDDLEVVELGAGILSYLDTNSTRSGSVFYSLTCRNAMGDSAPSEEVTVTVPQIPGRVSSLKATVSEGKVTLTWDRPEGSAVSHFKIYRRTEDRGTVLVGTVNERETSFIDVSPIIGRSSYYVIAMNERGLGEPSEDVDVTVQGETEERDSGPVFLAISISLLMMSFAVFSTILLIKRKRKK